MGGQVAAGGAAGRGGQGVSSARDRSAGTRASRTRVVLPEPDTPATATNFPSGTSMSMFLRLCTRAPNTLIAMGTEGGFPAMRVRLRVLHADGDAPHHRGAAVLSLCTCDVPRAMTAGTRRPNDVMMR